MAAILFLFMVYIILKFGKKIVKEPSEK